MWHKRRGRICGVLNDFDLSSFRNAIGASSKQRTGTRPFMAHELHALDANGNPPVHLYRHDLESIFYLIVLLTCAYALKKVPSKDGSYLHANKSSLYHSWFSMTDNQLYKEKHAIISTYNARAIPVPDNSFKDFAAWNKGLYKTFEKGIANRGQWAREAPDEEDMDVDENARVSFDEETMNDAVTYDAILNIMKIFGKDASGNQRPLERMYPVAKKD
ncbi:hypothetical protein CPB85DRAFT_1327190 [Mucidula mucida]|nr:hypothetical protein CPB85DRAFT_1327190 [Mucidula mucida]